MKVVHEMNYTLKIRGKGNNFVDILLEISFYVGWKFFLMRKGE